MPLMNEAVPQADFDRREKGLPPIKVEAPKRPEPEPPAIKGQLTLDDLATFEQIYDIKLLSASRYSVKNEEGITFIGFRVMLDMTPKKDKVEKSKDLKQEQLESWMIEGEFLAFVRNNRKDIDQQVISW